jgi:hypothetical protein
MSVVPPAEQLAAVPHAAAPHAAAPHAPVHAAGHAPLGAHAPHGAPVAAVASLEEEVA